MTGKSYAKTRVILSSKMLSPLASRKSFNQSAIAFRRSVNKSVSAPRLDANVSVKALASAPSKGNTDGKKRTNKGGIPGVETFDGGYRYNPNQKWEPGKVLKFHTNYYDRMNQRIQTPNWGWVDDTKNAEKKPQRRKPTIVKKKYKVNPKTNEVIENSVVELSPFTATGNEPNGEFGTKQLPGKTIGQIMRGASLLQSAARAVGVLTDSDGKLRCPPGTPAANQFTDAMGSNCFGFSASEIYDLAQRVAHEAGHLLNEVSDTTDSSGGLASGGRTKQRGSLLNTVRGWRTLIGDAIEQASEIPWMSTGKNPKDLQPSDWELDSMPDDFGWFKDGALRGRRNLRDMRSRVKSLLDSYGIRNDPDNFDKNHELIELADRLRADGIMTTQFTGRPQTREQWLRQADATLRAKFGDDVIDGLSAEKYEELMQRELDLQFEMERAMLSEFLMSYTEIPEHMRTINELRWDADYDMGTNVEAQAIWDSTGNLNGQTRIDLNLPRISHSAQEHLPEILETERARLEAIGGGSEAENAAALHDFIVSSYVYSKQTAALIGGTESFARHIMAHEISHTIQISAVMGAIADEISRTGRIRFFNNQTQKWEYKQVSSIRELTNRELNMIASQVITRQDGVKKILPSLQKVIDDANNMRWLAGKYTEDIVGDAELHQAFEIMAELAALRKQGIIHGPDVDDALAFMDEHVDTRFIDERGISDAEETARFLDLITYAQAASPEDVAEVFGNPLWTEERIYADSRAMAMSDIARIDSDDEVIDFIASKEFEVEQLLEKVRANPEDTELGRALKDAREELNEAKKKWRELNDGIDSSVLQEKVKRRRNQQDKLSPEELKKRNEKRDLEKIRNHAETASEDDIVNILASLKKKLEDTSLSEESRAKLKRYVDTYRKAFAKRRRESGDTRNNQAIAKDLDRRIKDRINPPKPKPEQTEPEAMSNPDAPKTKGKKPKPIKTPKNDAAVTRHVEKEREKLFKESTAKERVALVELSDLDNRAIAEILDPEKRIDAIDRIRRLNDEILSLGIEPDPTSYTEGSVEEQLENILMPVLDVLERSSLESSVEVEAVIKLTPEQIDGSDGDPISVDSMISGRLITGTKGRASGEPGAADSETGKVAHRVVIQAEAGQRGYYPSWSDSSTKKPAGYEQKVVLPPGKLEIVDRVKNRDGSTTLVARIVEQKNTEEILDGILDGPDSEDIQPGAKVQVQRAVNKHIVDRRKRGITSQQKTPQDEKDRIEEVNDLSFDVLNSENGSFGTQPDENYADDLDVDSDSPDSSEEEVFGPVQTREERRKERAEELADTVNKIKTVFETGEADEEIGISLDDIDPEIVRILEDSSPEEIEQMLADEAEKLHNEIDARPRDVVEEEELDELLDGDEDEEFPRDGYKPGARLQRLFDLLESGDMDTYLQEIGEPETEEDEEEDPLVKLIRDLHIEAGLIGEEAPSGQAATPESKPKPQRPSFPTSRRPKREDDAQKPGGGSATPGARPTPGERPTPPGDVDLDTGERIIPGARVDPISPDAPRPQKMPRGIKYKSKYQRPRKSPTKRVSRVIRDRRELIQVLNEIQGLITGGKYAYQERQNAAGLTIAGWSLNAFGTDDLSELTGEQIAWLIDMAVYTANQQRRPERRNQAEIDRDNKAIALGYMATALQDYLDILYIEANDKTPYPPGDWQMLVRWDSDEGKIVPGILPSADYPEILGPIEQTPMRMGSSGSQSSAPGLNPRLRPVSPTGKTINEDIIEFGKLLGRAMADSIAQSRGYDYGELDEVSLDIDMSSASAEELLYYAEEMERSYFQLIEQFAPELEERAEKIINDMRDLAERKERGLASGGLTGKISARVARKLIGPIVDRLDTDDDTKERIKIIADMVAATAAKGPTGALVSVATEAARRGGREVAEIALKKLVDSGKITEEQSKLAMLAVDRVAPEGLPDPITDALVDAYKVMDRFVDEKLLTDENKQRLSEAADEAKEKLIETTEQARESIGEAAQKAKEKTKKGLARLKRRKEEFSDVPDVDDALFEAFSDPNDPFASLPVETEKPQVASAFDDPFASPPTSQPVEQEPSMPSGRQRLMRRVRRDSGDGSNTQRASENQNSTMPEYDPFAGLSSGRRRNAEQKNLRSFTRVKMIHSEESIYDK